MQSQRMKKKPKIHNSQIGNDDAGKAKAKAKPKAAAKQSQKQRLSQKMNHKSI